IPSRTRSRVSSSHCRCSLASGSPAETRASSALVISFTSLLLVEARHGLVDPLRERERPPPLGAGHPRRPPFADRRDEVVDLAPQRLGVGHGHLAALDRGLRARVTPQPPRLDLATRLV